MSSLKIFVDDYRDPSAVLPYMLETMGIEAKIYAEGWVVCRTFWDFEYFVKLFRGDLDTVSFDYDLLMTHGKEITGLDFAKFLKDYTQPYALPTILYHSTNKEGIELMKKALE